MSVTSLARIEVGLATLRSQYNQATGQKSLLLRQQTEKQDALGRARTDIEVWQQVQMLFAKASEFARTQLVQRVQETVTAALQAVFGDEISFRIEMKEINGKPAADWVVETAYGNELIAGDPQESNGGGVVDVVSLALRLALLELSRPALGGPILLDEVGKHVDETHQEALGAFLKSYARHTNKQILLITHQEKLAAIADITYRVERKNGASAVYLLPSLARENQRAI